MINHHFRYLKPIYYYIHIIFFFRFIIDVYLSAYHLGTCIVYAVFMAVNVKQVKIKPIINKLIIHYTALINQMILINIIYSTKGKFLIKK